MRFLRIFLGNILITFAYATITVPRLILNGGVTSFSLVLQAWTHIDIGILVNLLTMLLILISYIFLGKRYFVGALFSSFCHMGLFNLFHWTGWVVNIPFILAVPVAALMVASGYYLCLSAESTAVSFDTIALILHQKNPRFDVAITMTTINMLVLLSGGFTYHLTSVIAGIIFTTIQGLSLKAFLYLGHTGIVEPDDYRGGTGIVESDGI